MSNSWGYSLILAFCIPIATCAQPCKLAVTGTVNDVSTGMPIPYANVYVKETQTGDVTDSIGRFELSDLCQNHYHLTVSHLGCENFELYLDIRKDTFLTVLLDHNDQLLDEVSIISQADVGMAQERQSLTSDEIKQHADKDLGTMLENISGVSTIKNGSGISKPIVHGLYGNRLTILNNGVAQSGQQWGIDHGPEIDPLAAEKITVVKGVGVLEYLGNSLGSVVLIESKRISQEPHLHGEGRYYFQTNGLGSGLNLTLQQYGERLSWKAVGTLKKNGDKRAPKYHLRNTGKQEANIAIQLERKWSDQWRSELYISSFNAEIGVLRGAHVGNIRDLEEALGRDVPFFTQQNFSYSIDAPSQKVSHHLTKFTTIYNDQKKRQLKLTYAGQYNLRREYDVRRSGRSDLPALSLKQVSNFLEAKYQHFLSKGWELKSGAQLSHVDNVNLPETGILPLIPDYISIEYGLYTVAAKQFKNVDLEFGARYDYEHRDIAAISTSLPREIVRYENNYHNLSAMGGATYRISRGWTLTYNVGFANRNPEVNELYSNGLHQGVSGIEEGTATLNSETSFKNTLSLKGNIKNRISFESLVYQHNISDYIYLSPQNEIRTTIRGAFPVFRYQQTDARIWGVDIDAAYQMSDKLDMTIRYSYLYGRDATEDRPLVYMPPNSLTGELNYRLSNVGKLHTLTFQVNSRLVLEQQNLQASQDFVPPPPTYHLLGGKIFAKKQWHSLGLEVYVRAENLLNVRYRDYLNRQRYFADDLGINVITGLSLSF